MADTQKNQIKVESLMNREDDSLPYGYYSPESEGKLCWICGYDAEGKITSVFCFDHGTHKERHSQYLQDIEKAKNIREDLINGGWKKLKVPEVTFSFPGEKEPRNLTRKEKRYLKKKIKNLNKQNPFEQE